MQNYFIFVSQESPLSLHVGINFLWWCQRCPPHSPLGAVIVLRDDASELDKAICIFHFAAFCFSVFGVWWFPLVKVCAVLYASDCGKILQA